MGHPFLYIYIYISSKELDKDNHELHQKHGCPRKELHDLTTMLLYFIHFKCHHSYRDCDAYSFIYYMLCLLGLPITDATVLSFIFF